MTSHFEGFIHAVQEQEINTKVLMVKRQLSTGVSCISDNRCRLCKLKPEDISHITAGCEKMSSTYYIPLRHDVVAKVIWNALHREHCANATFDRFNMPTDCGEFIDTHNNHEFWWNIPIKTCTKVKNNRPDIVMWDHERKTCTVIEIACPLDVNIISKENEKEAIYGPLLRNMQIMYPKYSFSFVPIIIGATGFVGKSLKHQLLKLGFAKKAVPRLITSLQVQAASGTVKIVKTFMRFKVL
jgi:hypothetical protein